LRRSGGIPTSSGGRYKHTAWPPACSAVVGICQRCGKLLKPRADPPIWTLRGRLLPAVGCAQIAGLSARRRQDACGEAGGCARRWFEADHRLRGSPAGQAAGLCLAAAIDDHQVLAGRQYRPPLGFRRASRCPVGVQGGDVSRKRASVHPDGGKISPAWREGAPRSSLGEGQCLHPGALER
jgi:hypothetical protein